MTNDSPSLPAAGSVHTLVPHDLAVSGGGVARLDGFTVFLDKGLPGETLRCRIVDVKPRFARAEVLETLTPSPDEVPSFCPHADRCGGCAWTTLRYEAQLAWKERQVKETLRRIGKVAFNGPDTVDGAEYLPITPSPGQTGYRNKMEFAFGIENGEPALGLREKNSHEIVSIGECALSFLPVKDILARTREWMRTSALLPYGKNGGYLRFLVVRCPEYSPDGTPRCLVELITAPGNRSASEAVAQLGRILMENASATGFIHSIRAAKNSVAYGEKAILRLGEITVTEKMETLLLQAPPQAFLQTNTRAATLLYGHVRSWADRHRPSVIWDVYCGVGGIGLFLLRDGITLRGIESVSEAVRFARINAARVTDGMADGMENAPSFIQSSADADLSRITPKPDLVVTDPPRAGMDANLRGALLRLRPEHIIAVGCDAASLARDVALLAPAYRVRSVRAVDLFPHTPHVEIAALLALAII